ncbi:MAG: hypothetical protein V5A68_00670 [Candidatus Thermoplasmatota archaeon]
MPNVLIEGLKERIEKAIKVNQSVGIVLPGNNYTDLLNALYAQVEDDYDSKWVYICATRPYSNLLNEFEGLRDLKNIDFIDCISRAGGISNTDPNCVYIESPTMLEKLGLAVMNTFKNMDENTNKYLVLDSLTNLVIYNHSDIVTEFFYHLINRTRAKDIHMVSLAIEEGEINKNINKLIYLNDKILKVKDSFL